MKVKYVIRLDDASEYMDHTKWNAFFDLFDRYKIKPIIAVIPFNKDPKMVNSNPDALFWEKVRIWQLKGYRIALHGFEHVYSNTKSGIIGLNNYTEFAGVTFEKQCSMLEQGYRKFLTENVSTEIFVAPAHSFDRDTLKALKNVTKINIISDGYFINPVKKDGFNWIPQQLWSPKRKRKGLWTICYHPETSSELILADLEKFLLHNSELIIDPLSLEFGNIKIEDIIFTLIMKSKIKIQRVLKRLK
jgi:hypothetical protein